MGEINSRTIKLNMAAGLSAAYRDRREETMGPQFKETGLKVGRFTLDKHIETLTIRKLHIDRTVDVDATNRFRVGYVLDKKLSPVLRRGNLKGYRVVQKDADGVLNFGYTQTMPAQMVALSDAETVPIDVAATYLSTTAAEVRIRFKQESLRLSGKGVNLNDLNKLKK